MVDSNLQVGLLIVVPFLLGCLLSSKIFPADFILKTADSGDDALVARMEKIRIDSNELATKEQLNPLFDGENPFAGLKLSIHRNGEPKGCTNNAVSGDHVYAALAAALRSFDRSPSEFDMWDVDSFLTTAFGTILLSKDECGSHTSTASQGKKGQTYRRDNRHSKRHAGAPEFLKFCDMGDDHTPILPDHDNLVTVAYGNRHGEETLPCHFHTREGIRVTSLKQLAKLAKQAKEDTLSSQTKVTCVVTQDGSPACSDITRADTGVSAFHLYAVPAGRLFMFAPSYIGEIFDLPHVEASSGLPVSLEVLSLSPRVFDVWNFYDKSESESIVTKALNEKSESHRIKRSSTGSSGYNINSKRTSENAFDTHGKTATLMKKRCFDVLGFHEYIESFADGLQVLRYNLTTAYIPHLDWIDDYHRREEHNFDSAGVGSNRFATILLYMSDLGENDGGETVFSNAWPSNQPEEERVSKQDALKALRESGHASALTEGSWEEDMVADCRTRLAIRPHSSRAVLFYSQHPNGEPDESSHHGGCPVLRGEKWAANLWVWNAPRGGYPGSPVNQDVVDKNRANGAQPEANPGQLHATFINSGKDPTYAKANLYFQETYWGPLSHGDDALSVNTYEGHEWNVMSPDGTRLQQWIINSEKKQVYTV